MVAYNSKDGEQKEDIQGRINLESHLSLRWKGRKSLSMADTNCCGLMSGGFHGTFFSKELLFMTELCLALSRSLSKGEKVKSND